MSLPRCISHLSRCISQHHRTFLEPNLRSNASRYSQQNDIPVNSKVDFLGIEKEWEAKWDAQGTKIQEERDIFDYHRLAPFYMDHIRKPTLMGTLQSILAKKRCSNAHKVKKNMVELILCSGGYETSLPGFRWDDLHAYSQSYGRDVVRTYVIFNLDSLIDKDSHIDERSIISTQKWFEQVWDAVRVAHASYKDSDTGLDGPVNLEAHDDPDMIENFLDHQLHAVTSLVHVPPTIPKRFDMSTDKETCALWLASQEAIISMTRKSNTVDTQAVQTCLSSLANSILRCEGEDGLYWIDRGVHYHSTRILLSLIALFAPSFAEASWLALHYGHVQWHDGDQYKEEETNTGIVNSEPEEWIREDLMKIGYCDLLRQDDP
ncbi:hypothetical protein HBI57_257180, partial [Parastagonospora nodorum]